MLAGSFIEFRRLVHAKLAQLLNPPNRADDVRPWLLTLTNEWADVWERGPRHYPRDLDHLRDIVSNWCDLQQEAARLARAAQTSPRPHPEGEHLESDMPAEDMAVEAEALWPDMSITELSKTPSAFPDTNDCVLATFYPAASCEDDAFVKIEIKAEPAEERDTTQDAEAAAPLPNMSMAELGKSPSAFPDSDDCVITTCFPADSSEGDAIVKIEIKTEPVEECDLSQELADVLDRAEACADDSADASWQDMQAAWAEMEAEGGPVDPMLRALFCPSGTLMHPSPAGYPDAPTQSEYVNVKVEKDIGMD